MPVEKTEDRVVEDNTKVIKMGDIVPNKRPIEPKDTKAYIRKKKKELGLIK